MEAASSQPPWIAITVALIALAGVLLKAWLDQRRRHTEAPAESALDVLERRYAELAADRRRLARELRSAQAREVLAASRSGRAEATIEALRADIADRDRRIARLREQIDALRGLP